MSVFSTEPKNDNPVTSSVLDETCERLGVQIQENEKEDYRKLLAVFHDSATELMEMSDFDSPCRPQKIPTGGHTLPRSRRQYIRSLGVEMFYPWRAQPWTPRWQDSCHQGQHRCSRGAHAHWHKLRKRLRSSRCKRLHLLASLTRGLENRCHCRDSGAASRRTYYWEGRSGEHVP